MKIELDNIRLRKSSYYPCLSGYFGFSLLRNEKYIYSNEITLFCEDRKDYLIEGLLHELTEMTIKKLLVEFGYEIECERHFLIDGIYFKIHHLTTVLSLPYYGVQAKYASCYETMLKTHKKPSKIEAKRKGL